MVGTPANFWLFSNRNGFDLTHPPTPNSPPVYPRISMSTTNSPITVTPSKTALVIIDMQNFFLSAALGRKRGEGHDAEAVLLEHAIPAAREADIQIVWLTWGISDQGLTTLPPSIWRIFGFEIADESSFEVEDDGTDLMNDGTRKMLHRSEKKTGGGIGDPIGDITLPNGSVVNAGRTLIRDQWNTELHGNLAEAFQTGLKAGVPDVRFHKERLSGLLGPSTEVESFLNKQGIKTLLFAGVNTDQCVLATIQDAASMGFDTILLRDGCGTTSPEYARQMVDFNCQKSWGFVSSCVELASGVRNIIRQKVEEGPGSYRNEL
ncbi:hypothetical protein MMC25_002830 [Agyrium rufum]|nr:hypothetical protein [Agyrium rufum]